jgi:hypothetical protein
MYPLSNIAMAAGHQSATSEIVVLNLLRVESERILAKFLA